MKLLLDTHTLLWFLDGNPALSPSARRLIEDPINTSVVSIASLWEMAIKVSLGKLTIRQPFETFMFEQVQANGFTLLGITPTHTVQVAALPFPANDHRDPFDRLIIAQALVEQMPIVSQDGKFDAYSITRLW